MQHGELAGVPSSRLEQILAFQGQWLTKVRSRRDVRAVTSRAGSRSVSSRSWTGHLNSGQAALMRHRPFSRSHASSPPNSGS